MRSQKKWKGFVRALPLLLAVLLVGCGGDGGRGPTAILFSAEGNRLNAYDLLDGLRRQTVIESHSLDPANGRDVNGQLCFDPDGSRRFVMGEDTFQPNPPQGWGFFQLVGDRLSIDGIIATPNAAVESPQGTFYVSSVLNGVVAEYDADGVYRRTVLSPPVGESLPYSTGSPFGLIVGGEGTLYYADIGLAIGASGPGPQNDLGTVRRIRFEAGTPTAPETIDSGLNFPDGLGLLEE